MWIFTSSHAAFLQSLVFIISYINFSEHRSRNENTLLIAAMTTLMTEMYKQLYKCMYDTILVVQLMLYVLYSTTLCYL